MVTVCRLFFSVGRILADFCLPDCPKKTQKPKKNRSNFIPPSAFFLGGGGTFLAAGGQLSKFSLKILATLLVFRRLYNCAVNSDLSSVWLS